MKTRHPPTSCPDTGDPFTQHPFPSIFTASRHLPLFPPQMAPTCPIFLFVPVPLFFFGYVAGGFRMPIASCGNFCFLRLRPAKLQSALKSHF